MTRTLVIEIPCAVTEGRNLMQSPNLFILEGTGYIYTRLMNPTFDFLEGRVTAFEEGIGISPAASGMAAEMIAFAPLAKQGNSRTEGDTR